MIARPFRYYARLKPDGLAQMTLGDEDGGAVVRMLNSVGVWPWAQVKDSTRTPTQIVQVRHRAGETESD